MADETSESPLPLPGDAHASGSRDSAAGPACPYCLAPFGATDVKTRCPECSTLYHLECWNENGGCGVYGCGHAATVEPRQAIEVPSSYWGAEHKPCPACGKEILAAAVRCRHCGATFSTARPQQLAEYQSARVLQDRLPAAQRQVITIFVLSTVPFLSPIGLIAGWIWRGTHRHEREALPPLHAALHRIGLITSAVVTGGLTLLTLLYFAVRG